MAPEIDTAQGLVVLYQPQLDEFAGNQLEARMAVSVTPKGKDEPVFGAVWLKARVETDFDTRTVQIVAVDVPRVRFPNATKEQEQGFSQHLAREIPSWNLDLSLDRLLAMLEIAESRRQSAEGFDNNPPKVIFVTYPAILVSIDGEPQLRDVEGTGLKYVVNTRFLSSSSRAQILTTSMRAASNGIPGGRYRDRGRRRRVCLLKWRSLPPSRKSKKPSVRRRP